MNVETRRFIWGIITFFIGILGAISSFEAMREAHSFDWYNFLMLIGCFALFLGGYITIQKTL